jgi:predicted aldo/keto reductase-like oxidoreductase
MKKLGFGQMRLPLLDAKDVTKIDYEETCRMVDSFLEQGFTYVDTAYMYHEYESERMVRRALVERHPRESFVLADKLPTMMLKTKEDQERIFNEQLEKCGVEYFDYYLLHCLNKNNFATVERLGSFAFGMQKKKEGKIRKLGFSFHDNAALLDEILTKHPETEFVQIQLNYLDWESEKVQSRLCYEVCEKHNMPVIVMEPVKGGALAEVPVEAKIMMQEYSPNATVASWAVRFAASHKNVFMVLSGMSDMKQLLDNTSYIKEFVPINKEETEILMRAVDIINSSIEVSCTGCRYCVEGCPKNIPIPNYFALYNGHKRLGQNSKAPEIYQSMNGFGKAGDCISCKQCEGHCPQHLPIAEKMKAVSKVFDN